MAIIELSTVIGAPQDRVFDLARSIDAHQFSAERTRERAVAGVTAGLIGPNDEVTWEATHLGVRQRLRVRITEFKRPDHFQDAMVSGAFKRMVHDHDFSDDAAGTRMRDRFEFEAPFGILGKIVERVFLTSYMRNFLIRRNEILKRVAESEEWRRYVKQN
jgi:ligand-binding SRPBCC domain-containing protein